MDESASVPAESLTKEFADRLSRATAKIQKTEERRETLTRLGRPPKTAQEPSDAPDDGLAVRAIERLRPPDIAGVENTPENLNQILCSFMVSAMEVLAGIAEHPHIPIALRKDAAKILLESGLATIPKKVQSLSASLNAKTIDDFTKLFDRMPTDALSRMMNEPEPPQEEVHQPLGQLRPADHPVTAPNLMAQRTVRIEDKIMALLRPGKPMGVGAVGDEVRHLKDARRFDWRTVLESLVDRGLLVISKGKRGGRYVQLASAAAASEGGKDGH